MRPQKKGPAHRNQTESVPQTGGKTYLCFDLGTSKIKAALLSSEGRILYLGSENAASYREGEALIQKPREYVAAVEKQIEKMAQTENEALRNAASLICSGQMAGILSIDRNWEVVMPWTYSADSRSDPHLYHIEAGLASAIRASSGGAPHMAAKIKWIQKAYPDQYRASQKFINLNTYVAGGLAGLAPEEAFIDCSVLSMSGLADIRNRTWNPRILETLDIDPVKLPRIVPPDCRVGTIPRQRWNTHQDIKVHAGIGDPIAGVMGAGATSRGDLIDAAGTYSVLGCCSRRFIPDPKGRAVTCAYAGVGDLYYHMGVPAVGGMLHAWFLEKFGYDWRALGQARDTRSLYFLPYLGGRPTPPQPHCQGTYYGIGWAHDLDSMYTALLEGMGYEYALLYEKIKALQGPRHRQQKSIRAIGGGSANRLWNALKADILGLEYRVLEPAPYEILGSFLVARYGQALAEHAHILSADHSRITPNPDQMQRQQVRKQTYKKITRRIGRVYQDLRKDLLC